MSGKFIISQEDWGKIIAWAKLSYDELKSEIGGMLVAFLDKDTNQMTLKDPVIGKQVVSGGNCTLDKEWLADYYCKMAMKHGTSVRFVWWHSHHTMGAFWSGTDLEAIREFSSGKYSMSLVVNLKEEYKFRVNWWEPTHGHIDHELTIQRPIVEINNQMKSIFKKLISKETAIVPRKQKYPTSNISSYYYNDWSNRYKQPGNENGPGYVDAELMDRPETLQEKYCDLMEALMDKAFSNDLKWPAFTKAWSKIMEDAAIHRIVINDFPKKDFSELMIGRHFPDATTYFEEPDPELFLSRGGDTLQRNLFNGQ